MALSQKGLIQLSGTADELSEPRRYSNRVSRNPGARFAGASKYFVSGLVTDHTFAKILTGIVKPVDFKAFGNKSSVYVWGHEGVEDHLVNGYIDIFSGTSDKAERITETMNVTQYYIDKAEHIGLKDYPSKFLTAAEFITANDTNVRANALYGKITHGEIVSVKLLLQALIKYYVANETSRFSSGMTFQTHKAKELSHRKLYLMTMMLLAMALALMSQSVIEQLLDEKQTGAIQLLQISGIDPITLWFSNFCSHFSMYTLAGTVVIIIMWNGAPKPFINGGRVWILLLAIALNGFAMLPQTYVIGKLFKSRDICVTVILLVAATGGALPSIENLVSARGKMKQDGHENTTLDDVISLLSVVLSVISPQYHLVTVLLVLDSAYTSFGDEATAGMVLGKSDIQEEMMKMAAQCACYFLLVFAIESSLLRRIRYKYLPSFDIEHLKATSEIKSTDPVDDDVIAEKRRIQDKPVQKLCKENPLIIKGVSKVYGGKKIAVDDMYLGVAQNECFGLLGQNGAGKSTSFKMLTGEVAMSTGDIYFLCKDVKTSFNSILQHVGYCPQHNPIDDNLTGRETLYLHGRLRGVPEKNLDNVTKQLLECLTITPHADKLTCDFSGGNKRKLCVAISLIGNPHFILLDEPTAGVDPAARRVIWDVFRDVRSAGKTIIVTSHSMEECEALCTRLAIMVTGRFCCVGSLQHLKNKFTQGLAISVKTGPAAEMGEGNASFLNFVQQSFTNCQITENGSHYIHFVVLDKGIQWSTVFRTMETAKEKFSLFNYSVQQTTLEQIFLRFVKGANPPTIGIPSYKEQCLSFCCDCE